MRNKLGIACMLAGVLLAASSLGLYLHNENQASQAADASALTLPQIVEQIPAEPDTEVEALQLAPVEFITPVQREMTEILIDGRSYIGYLSIPTLELELPVLSGWTYELLKIAPCRYYGTLRGEDLVLMAHNYPKHFGQISLLKIGEELSFTDMDGITTHYQVVARDVLDPGAVEEMTAGHYDLTLFTCTYGGENRITVGCDILK